MILRENGERIKEIDNASKNRGKILLVELTEE